MYLELRGDVVWCLQMSFFSAGGELTAATNPLAGFDGPLEERERGERKGREGKREGGRRTGENTPRNKFLVAALCAEITLL